MNILPLGFTVRRATVADLASFAVISRRTFLDTYSDSHSAEVVERHVASRFTEGALRDELLDPARTVLALTHDEDWVGYAILKEGSAPAAVTGARPAEVERFYVERAWHGQGLAASLMEALLSAARERRSDTAWLGVWMRNPRAVRFYEKQGFRVVGQQVYVFDGQPEDDHLMECVL